MAKIDLSTVENYSSMTPEEKVAFFEAYELPEVPKPDNTEADKLKAALSKANAEAASYKRELREKQTEQERLESERKEADQKKDELIAQYEAERRVSSYTKKFVEAGYDIETASKMAQSLPAGVADDYFAATKTYLEAKTKEIESAALNKQPSLTPGAPPTAGQADKDEQNKMRSWFGLPPIK